MGDLQAAGEYHRQVLRRIRRGDTLAHTRIATQNMGAWYAEAEKPRHAAFWLGRAANLAGQEGNPSLAASLLRSQAIQLMRAGTLDRAEEVMRLAVSMSDGAGDPRGAAEARADLAAILLTGAAKPSGQLGVEEERFSESDALLRLALDFFTEIGDTDWIDRIWNNRISLSLLRGDAIEAIDHVLSARTAIGSSRPTERLALDRRGMQLSLTEARRPDLSVAFARDAADLAASGLAASDEQVPGRQSRDRPSGSAAAAWELALGGAMLRDHHFALDQAIILFREAQELSVGDESLTFHITNDLGLAYEDSGDREAAIECFDRCLQIASERDDRYMRQQALANRGELGRRMGTSDAIPQLQEAVELAKNLLDIEAEAMSLLNLAWCHIDQGDLSGAEQTLVELQTLFNNGLAGIATLSTVESIRGGIAFKREEYWESYAWHIKAASHATSPKEHFDAMASALWPLIKVGDRRRYRSLLGRLVRAGQQADRDGQIAELIAPYGIEWVALGAVGMAARTLSDAILLGISQWTKDVKLLGGDTGLITDELWANGLFEPLAISIVQLNGSVARRPELRQRLLKEVFARVRRQLPESDGDFVASWIEQLADMAWESLGAI